MTIAVLVINEINRPEFGEGEAAALDFVPTPNPTTTISESDDSTTGESALMTRASVAARQDDPMPIGHRHRHHRAIDAYFASVEQHDRYHGCFDDLDDELDSANCWWELD